MELTEGALDWPLLPTGVPAGKDPDQWAQAEALAVFWLWAYSGRQYGTRQVTYRPQALIRSAVLWRDDLPYLQSIFGPLFGEGWPYLGDPRNGSLTTRQVLELPGPAQSVASVTIDGVVLAPAAYRLDGNWLVRVDGDLWPITQDLVAAAGASNTWAVVYERGSAVPLAGQVAAYQLALAYYKTLSGDPGSCKLPYNATTVSRAGVTINRDVALAFKTSGVEAADRWVQQVNPGGLTRPPAVWSPDVARNGRPYLGSGIPKG